MGAVFSSVCRATVPLLLSLSNKEKAKKNVSHIISCFTNSAFYCEILDRPKKSSVMGNILLMNI